VNKDKVNCISNLQIGMFYLKEFKKNLVFKSSYRNVLNPTFHISIYTQKNIQIKWKTEEINLLLSLFGLIASCLIFGKGIGN
jgi:hypothetical protein